MVGWLPGGRRPRVQRRAARRTSRGAIPCFRLHLGHFGAAPDFSVLPHRPRRRLI